MKQDLLIKKKKENINQLDRRSFLTMSTFAAGAVLFPKSLIAENKSAEGYNDKQKPVRYPDPNIIALDKRFNKYLIGNTSIEQVWTGALWAEGTAWNPGGRYLVWSDIPNDRLMRRLDEDGHVSEFHKPSHNSNGNTFDFEGRLIACEHDNRRVVRFEHNGDITVLADKYNGKKLNSPNDVVVHPDGAIWFTDPIYGISGYYEGHKASQENKEAVYRIDPKDGSIEMVSDEANEPNGLCFSPDYKKLYVSDTGGGNPKGIDVYDIAAKKKLKNKRRFCSMEYNGKLGGSDGIRADIDGNIWSAAGWVGEGYDGVHIFSPEGERIGMILLPEICANLCFGGVKRNRLFMAASQSIYAVYVNAQPAHIT
jgi:gluconolactonase